MVGGSCTEVTLLLWHQLNEEEEAAADQELVDLGSKVGLEGRDCIDMKKGGGTRPEMSPCNPLSEPQILLSFCLEGV